MEDHLFRTRVCAPAGVNHPFAYQDISFEKKSIKNILVSCPLTCPCSAYAKRCITQISLSPQYKRKTVVIYGNNKRLKQYIILINIVVICETDRIIRIIGTVLSGQKLIRQV